MSTPTQFMQLMVQAKSLFMPAEVVFHFHPEYRYPAQ
jgi:hypothetical protein